MEALPQRITAVARSVDGLGLGLYSLISAVLPEASSGAGAWKDAINRNDRLAEKDRQTIPTTYMGKVEGNRKQTHVVLFEHAPSVLKFVLKEPMDFFGNTEAREAFAQLVGREFTDLVANALVTAEAEHTEACMCLLPALVAATDHVVTSMTRFRTTQLSDGQLLGSIYDFVTWLGLDEHVWRNWLADAFKTEIGRPVLNSAASDHFHGHPILENIAASGTTRLTPMTNYAGFCLILRLCAGRSTISDAMIDEATTMLGRVKVGDSRLHAEIEQNAAAASAEDKAFVLGPDIATAVTNDGCGIIQQQEQQQMITTAANLNATALLEVARSSPNVQVQMETYWSTAITLQTEVDRQRAQAQTAEAKALEQAAKAREATIAQEVKTKISDENNKRQVSGASRRADIAGHRATEIGHKATESEALCRIAEAKRRLAEIVGSSAVPPQRRRKISTTTSSSPPNNSVVAHDEDVAAEDAQQQMPTAAIFHLAGLPLRGRALAALKALPSNPEFNAYRAAGIPDNAVPRDEAQSNEWYELAHRQQLLLRPTSGVESRRSLLPRGSLDIYGQPVRPEFCCPPQRYHRMT